MRLLALCAFGNSHRFRAERAGLDDRALEQALGPRTGDEGCHILTARALAKDGHAARVTAKGCDIVSHPFQRPDLIEHAKVG